jgi:hypothetical protein
VKNKKNGSRNIVIAVVVAVVITLLSTFLVFSLLYRESGLPNQNPFGGVSTQQDQQGVPSASANVPSNPYLQISVAPSTVDRGESVSFSVSSNLVYAQIQVQALYEGIDVWENAFVLTLDSTGSFNQLIAMNYAGDWQVKAQCGNVESNVVHVAVEGITIYQQKTVWNVGEKYSAALTGTYKNWHVAVFFKDSSSSSWIYAFSSLTDENGVIPYNQNWVTIDVSAVGKNKDIICVLCPNDSSASELQGLFAEVEGMMMFSTVELDGLVSEGLVVKSNILSLSIQ